jgi:hypothetical protein
MRLVALTFNVQTLEGDLNGGDGSAAVVIDIIGRPLTPLSCAGVARRSAPLTLFVLAGNPLLRPLVNAIDRIPLNEHFLGSEL